MIAELRHDPHTDEWAVVARARGARPHPGGRRRCAFCPGQEAQTPPTSWELRGADGAWAVRAFANRFPILAQEGRSEVLVESRRHDWSPLDAAPGELRLVLEAYQARFRELRPDAAWLCAFHNQGPAAGRSIPHPHSQVVAARFLPPVVERRQAMLAARAGRGERPAAEQVEAAEALGLLLWREGCLATIVPRAGLPGEARIVPADGPRAFAKLDARGVAAAEILLSRLLAAQTALFGRLAYNWALAEPPLVEAPVAGFELRVVPRLATPGGFELASGLPVSELAPEDLAPRLRAAGSSSLRTSGESVLRR